MGNRVMRVRSDDGVAAATLREGIAQIQAELKVTPSFPAEVEAAAEAAASAPRLPELDRTSIPFLTIDPEGAMDLDQALHLERAGSGYVVHYAIADVAAFVTAGDPVDLEANRRGETLYGADSKVPLHPPTLSEGAASLLPDEVRPAFLWTIELDESGAQTSARVERALVRSRAKLSYDEVQASIDDGKADELFQLLQEVGERRLAIEAERGGVSLPLPEQEIDTSEERWRLEFRQLHPVELWNAQISLLTGMAAAGLMIESKVGLLRTLPPADPRDVARLRRTASALGIEWPEAMVYPEFIRSLDGTKPEHAAMVVACTRLLRGSGYAGFDGAVPDQPLHAAVAAPYAHVTAPLRRLIDRYALEICVSICAGVEVPGWVREKLDVLPGAMQESGQRANQYENAVLDLVEAHALASRVGESFDAVVVEVDGKEPTRGEVTIQEPAIEARVESDRPLPLGEAVKVTLAVADPATRKVQFRL